MSLPTAASIRADSKVDFAALGYPDDPTVQKLVDRALAMVVRWTGQSWDGTGVYSNGAPAQGTEPMAEQAVQTLTEWQAFRNQEDVVETLGDFDLIQNFSAGAYSESRRGGEDSLNANKAMLKALLWPLMTYDKQDEWIVAENGTNPPAFAVTEVDWSGRSLADGKGYDPGLPLDPLPGLIDSDPRW